MRVAPHEQEEQEEHFRKKNSGSIPKEKWISLEWDAEKWSSILDEKGLDMEVKRQFFLLAQHGSKGKQEANHKGASKGQTTQTTDGQARGKPPRGKPPAVEPQRYRPTATAAARLRE